MFLDLLWPSLLLFVAGQAASWYYMHTGRTRVGVAATVVLWVSADWFLVAKYVFDAAGPDLRLPLLTMQAAAALTTGALGFALWRRRWSAAAKQRPAAFAAGIAAYLRGDIDVARATLRRLVRFDPWDTAAWVALGNIELRGGEPRRARRCYLRALGLDLRKQYLDFVRHQMSLGVGAPRPPLGPAEPARAGSAAGATAT